MKNKLTEFDRHFKEQLSAQEVPPPADAWANIADQLDYQQASKPKPWYTYWTWSAAAIVLITGYFFFSQLAGTKQELGEKNLNHIAKVETKVTQPKPAFPESPTPKPSSKEAKAYKEPQERAAHAPTGIQKA